MSAHRILPHYLNAKFGTFSMFLSKDKKGDHYGPPTDTFLKKVKEFLQKLKIIYTNYKLNLPTYIFWDVLQKISNVLHYLLDSLVFI